LCQTVLSDFRFLDLLSIIPKPAVYFIDRCLMLQFKESGMPEVPGIELEVRPIINLSSSHNDDTTSSCTQKESVMTRTQMSDR